MCFPESVTKVLLAVGAGEVGFIMRDAGDAERSGPGEPDLDLPRGPLMECLSRLFDEPKNPEEVPYTEDMARGFAVASSFPPCDTRLGLACASIEGNVSKR